MKILCVFGRHNYGDPERGEGYEYSNFIPALRRLGHDIVHFETWNRSCYRSFAELNLDFLRTVKRESPDLIFCVLMHYEIWLETLETVRRDCPATIVNWSTDDSWKYAQFSRIVAPFFDLYATTYPATLKNSAEDGLSNFFLTQWAADSARLADPLPASQCRYDVSFVGTAYGNRPWWVASLKKRGISVACFGHGWSNGTVSTEEILAIIRESAISLNFGDSGLVWSGLVPHRSRQIKARVFEVPGAGGFLVTESADNLEHFYNPGKEIIVFDDVDDLAAKIKFFLAHPAERDEIARAGHRRTSTQHTYDLRFKELLERITESSKSNVSRPKGCRIDIDGFGAFVKSHEVGWMLKMLKFCLLAPCLIVMGRRRGPRLARRVMFEISWRFLGRQTYSARGLPGRLFYKES